MNKIEIGDCRHIMRKWASEGVEVQTCITSPPYFGLRDYGVDGQIGLEETPEEYINNLVEVFRCVRDILSDDGTLWINIGDSYFSNRKSSSVESKVYEGLKPKDLIGIPWMLAFALRNDGWFLRQDIIWNKPNSMPEAVTDRCGKSHEYIFLLSKSKSYYFDHIAIKEPVSAATLLDGRMQRGTRGTKGEYAAIDGNCGFSEDGMRNKRSVWTVNTKPYLGAHFAVFPEALILPCVLAGTKINDIVLDPFMGSGTTAAVAKKNNRNYLGCDLNIDYQTLQDDRLFKINPLEEFLQ